MDIFYEDVNDLYMDIYKRKTSDMPFFHYHDAYEIFIITEGSRDMIVNDNIYNGSKRDVFMIPSKCIHRSTGKGCERIVLNFSENFLKNYFTDRMIKELLVCFDVFVISLNEQEIKELRDMCEMIIDKENTYSDAWICLNLAKILQFLSDRMDGNINKKEKSISTAMVSNILDYIHSNYKYISGINEIAERFHISRDYMCRVFKKHTQTTIMSYINSLKVDEARKMIILGGKNLDAIADEVGFSSGSYLSKIFKSSYGMSPDSYKKENRKKNLKMESDGYVDNNTD